MKRILLKLALVLCAAVSSALAQPEIPTVEEPPSGYQSVSELQVSPDGKLLVGVVKISRLVEHTNYYAPVECRLQIWDIATGEQKWNVVHEEHAHLRLQFSPDSSRVLLVRSKLGTGKNYREGAYFGVELRDAATGSLTGLMELEESERVEWFVFTPDGRRILGKSSHSQNPGRTASFKVWDALSGKLLQLQKEPLPLESFSGFSQDGQRVITRRVQAKNPHEFECALLVHSWPDLQPLHEISLGKVLAPEVVFSPDKSLVAILNRPIAGSPTVNEFEVGIWKLESAALQQLDIPAAGLYRVDTLAFSPEGHSVIGSGRVDEFGMPTHIELWFWNARTGEHERTLKLKDAFLYRNGGTDLRTALSADGTAFFIATRAATIELRSLEDGTLIRIFELRSTP